MSNSVHPATSPLGQADERFIANVKISGDKLLRGSKQHELCCAWWLIITVCTGSWSTVGCLDWALWSPSCSLTLWKSECHVNKYRWVGWISPTIDYLSLVHRFFGYTRCFWTKKSPLPLSQGSVCCWRHWKTLLLVLSRCPTALWRVITTAHCRTPRVQLNSWSFLEFAAAAAFSSRDLYLGSKTMLIDEILKYLDPRSSPITTAAAVSVRLPD